MAGNLELQGYSITPIPNLKKNPRRVFYRPRTGIPTLPLPADPYHTSLFLRRGFTLEPPVKEEQTPETVDVLKIKHEVAETPFGANILNKEE